MAVRFNVEAVTYEIIALGSKASALTSPATLHAIGVTAV